METFGETGICAIHRPFGAGFMARLAATIDDLLTAKPAIVRAFALPDQVRAAFTRIAATVAGKPQRLVRILVFDKTRDRNWGVAWHQDRTIAVRSRVDLPGFGPWSVKSACRMWNRRSPSWSICWCCAITPTIVRAGESAADGGGGLARAGARAGGGGHKARGFVRNRDLRG